MNALKTVVGNTEERKLASPQDTEDEEPTARGQNIHTGCSRVL